MEGFIIYQNEDANKNQAYIDMHKNEFKKYGVNLRLVTTDKLDKKDMPDFVINRSRDYLISKAFENKGIRVFNSGEVTRIANDKGITYKFLRDVVPFMPVEYEEEILISGINVNNKNVQYPYVLKSCNGHGGSQVFLINNGIEYKAAMSEIGNLKYVKQQCCSDLGKDVRVYVVGNKVVAAVLRTSANSFKSNFSLGGKVSLYKLNNQEQEYVEKITEVLPLDFAGIDFTFHNGQAVFNEIEDAAGARMLYANSDIDIVSLQVEYMIKELK